MAKKLPQSAVPKAKRVPAPKRSEAEILHPERDVRLSDDRVVTVREITFAESVRIADRFGALAAAVSQRAGTVEALLAALTDDGHRRTWCEFVALVSGLPVAEIEALPAADGVLLTLAAFGANTGFFGVTSALVAAAKAPPA